MYEGLAWKGRKEERLGGGCWTKSEGIHPGVDACLRSRRRYIGSEGVEAFKGLGHVLRDVI